MTYKLHNWQKDFFDKMQTGVRNGEMFIITTGRNVGKSAYRDTWNSVFNQHMTEHNFKIHDKAIVDGEQWYTVGCRKDVSAWLRTQPKGLWHEHIDARWTIHLNQFDIHEKIYTQLALKWS